MLFQPKLFLRKHTIYHFFLLGLKPRFAIFLPGRAEPFQIAPPSSFRKPWPSLFFLYVGLYINFFGFYISVDLNFLHWNIISNWEILMWFKTKQIYILYLSFSFGNWVLCHEYYGSFEVSINSSYAIWANTSV